jgi:uncharacterized protein (DUF2062 family)
MLKQQPKPFSKAETIKGISGGDRTTSPKNGAVAWLWKKVRDDFINPLLKSTHPPWYDARGVAMGLAVGFAVPVGGQVALMGVLRSVVRFNFLVAVAFSLISNPFDMIPLYYGYYKLGCWVTGMAPDVNYELFKRLMHPITQSDYFWEALSAFMALSREILSAWFVAAAILASIGAVAGYAVTYKIQTIRANRRAERLEHRYERVVEELEDRP